MGCTLMKVISVTLLPETSVPVQLLASPMRRRCSSPALGPNSSSTLSAALSLAGSLSLQPKVRLSRVRVLRLLTRAATGEGLP
ncbi:hypothetical protein D3C75_1078400 [compost metagenome]